jgi:hypothetical protein
VTDAVMVEPVVLHISWMVLDPTVLLWVPELVSDGLKVTVAGVYAE